MFERFSEQAKRVLTLARREAADLGHGHVGTEHLLLGVLAEGSSPAAKALTSAGATLAGCRDKAAEAVGTRTAKHAGGELPFSDRAARSLERAGRLSLRRRAATVDTEHILQSVLDVEGTAGQVLRGLSVDVAALRAELEMGPLAAGRDAGAGHLATSSIASPGAAATGLGRTATEPEPPATTTRGGATGPAAAGTAPCCATCGAALDVTLSHRRVGSHGAGGATVDLVVSFCSGCGSSLGAWPAASAPAEPGKQAGE